MPSGCVARLFNGLDVRQPECMIFERSATRTGSVKHRTGWATRTRPLPRRFLGIVVVARRRRHEPVVPEADQLRASAHADRVERRFAIGRNEGVEEDELADSIVDVIDGGGDDDAAVRVADQHDVAQVLEHDLVDDVVDVRRQVDLRAGEVDPLTDASEARCEHVMSLGGEQPCARHASRGRRPMRRGRVRTSSCDPALHACQPGGAVVAAPSAIVVVVVRAGIGSCGAIVVIGMSTPQLRFSHTATSYAERSVAYAWSATCCCDPDRRAPPSTPSPSR